MIKSYLPCDLGSIELSAAHREVACIVAADLLRLSLHDHCTTILSVGESEVVAILGAVIIDGVCEVFILPSVNVRRHAVTFWRDLNAELSRASHVYGRVRAFEAEPPNLSKYFSALKFEYLGPATRAGKMGAVWERIKWG